MSDVKVKVLKGQVIAGKGEAFEVGDECLVSKADAEFLVANEIAEVVADKPAKSAKKDKDEL